MSYPKQLITTLCEQLPEDLASFFTIEKNKYFKDYADINDLVAATMWEYIKAETSKEEISRISSLQVKMRRQKKSRWMAAYDKGINEYPVTDKKNPFYSIQEALHTLSGQAFIKIYETNDLESVIESQKQAVQDWRENDKSLLIAFPLINTKSKKQVLDSCKIDLIICLTQIIMDSMDGNLESYYAKKPAILLDNPLFSPTKYTVPFKQQTLDSYVADLVSYDKDDMVFQMLVNYEPNSSDDIQNLKVFDSRDNQILITLFNNIHLDFYQSRQIVIEVGAIAKSMVSRPNKRLYEDVKLRVHNMARTGFRLCKKDRLNDPVFTFSLFDSVETVKQNGHEYLVITFGNTLFEAIAKKKMISVTSSNYNSLDNDLSKLLYHHLQRERISLSTSAPPNADGLLYKNYDYSFFQRIILFKSKKKKENIQLITETLKEFKEKNIALSDFRYDQQTGLFHLYFFPLNEDEKADLLSSNELHEKELSVLSNSIMADSLKQ